ncbi:hypothetical protein JTB14_005797 [Gonioctena quinquepunctata]|nr:hypothetical protein JTB14_005797 [Gonioctena quinquepunctata]
MSATETKDPPSRNHFSKLPIHQLNPSYTVRVICCVFFIFLTEIFLAHYVYRLINSEIREDYVAKSGFRQLFLNEIRGDNFREEVKRLIKDFEFGTVNQSSRAKRSVKHGRQYNFLSAQAEEPQVEFFNPKIRGNLEEKDEEIKRKTGSKGAAPGGDSWIWVTSSSRIPETIFLPHSATVRIHVSIYSSCEVVMSSSDESFSASSQEVRDDNEHC